MLVGWLGMQTMQKQEDPEVAMAGASSRLCDRRAAMMPLLFLVLAFATTGGGWWPGRVLLPESVGGVTPSAPGSASASAFEPSPLQESGVDWRLQQLSQWVSPFKAAVRSMRDGHAPLWNPHQGIGQSLLGNGRVAAFYPTTLLHLPGHDPQWAWGLSAVLKLWVAGCGAWLLARRQRMGSAGAALAGVTFMLGGFQLIGLNATLTNVLCLLPWAVIASCRLWERVTTGRIAAMAVVVGLAALGADAVALAMLLLASALTPPLLEGWGGIKRWWLSGRWMTGWVLAVVIGLLLGAVQWFVVSEQWRQATVPGGARVFAEMPWGLALFHHHSWAPAFVGVIPFLFAIFSLKMSPQRRVVRTWMVIALAMGAITLLGLTSAVSKVHPTELSISGWGTWMSGCGLAIAMLSGCGLEALLRQLRRGELRDGITDALINLGIALAAVGGAWGIFWLLSGEATAWSAAGVRFGAMGVTLALAAVLWTAGVRRFRTREEGDPFSPPTGSLHIDRPPAAMPSARHVRWFGATWVALATIELLAFAIPYEWGTTTPAFAPLAVGSSWNATARFAATDGILPPNLASAYGVNDLRTNGHVSARWGMWGALLQFHPTRRGHVMGVDAKMDADTLLATRPVDAGQPLRIAHVNDLPLRLVGMQYLLTRRGDPSPGGAWTAVPGDGDVVDYENKSVMPRAWVAKEARHYASTREVFEQLTEPWNFDPHEVVLVDDPDEADVREWLESPPARRGRIPEAAAGEPWWQARGGGQRKGTVEYREESPEHRTITIKASGGGWLVIADACSPGWEAVVIRMERRRAREMTIRRPTPIVPAYGVMQAVAIPGGDVVVELIYRPWGWKYGLFGSAGGGIALLLVIGTGLLGKEQLRRRRAAQLSAG